jgi:hypothetical protein
MMSTLATLQSGSTPAKLEAYFKKLAPVFDYVESRTLSPLSQATQTQLAKTLQQQTEHQLDAFLKTAQSLIPEPKVNPAELASVLTDTLKPKPPMTGLLYHLSAWQFLPGAILTPLMLKWTLAKTGMPPEKVTDQVDFEVSRQLTGVGLQAVQTYGTKLAFDGIKAGSQQSQAWLAKAHQWKQQAQTPLQHWQGKGLETLSLGLQGIRRYLAKPGNDTLASMALLVLSNTVTFGVIRPLIKVGVFTQLQDLKTKWFPPKESTPEPKTDPASGLSLSAKPMAPAGLQTATVSPGTGCLSAVSVAPAFSGNGMGSFSATPTVSWVSPRPLNLDPNAMSSPFSQETL